MKLWRGLDDEIFALTVSATFLLLVGVGSSRRLPRVMTKGLMGSTAGTKNTVIDGVDQHPRSISRSDWKAVIPPMKKGKTGL